MMFDFDPVFRLRRLRATRGWNWPRASHAAMIAALMFATACQDVRSRAEAQAQAARAYFEAGNIVAASKAISEAIQLRDDNAEFFLLQGLISLRAGKPIPAFGAFDRALDLDQTNRTALAYVANLGVQIGRIKEAESAADRLLSLDADSLPALQVKGMIALSKGRMDEADKLADRIIAISPDDEAGTILRARSLAINGHMDEAIALIDKGLTARGATPVMLTNKLNVLRKMGRAQDMLPIYEKIVPLAGGNFQYRLEQINLLYKLGNVDAARQSSIDLLAAGSTRAEDYATLRRIWSQFDLHPIPLGAVDQIAGSKDPLATVNVVRFLILSGDPAMARRIVDAVPADRHKFVDSLDARLLAIRGQRDAARAKVDTILNTDGNDVDALILRGQFRFAEGDLNLALNDVQKALAADPLNPEPYMVLAGIYERRGEAWRAKQIFAEASKRLPQDYFIVERHLALLKSEREPGRVLSVATAFARAQPSAEKAWSILSAQCGLSPASDCKAIAEQGAAQAKTAYQLDDAPGTPVDRGLFGRL